MAHDIDRESSFGQTLPPKSMKCKLSGEIRLTKKKHSNLRYFQVWQLLVLKLELSILSCFKIIVPFWIRIVIIRWLVN